LDARESCRDAQEVNCKKLAFGVPANQPSCHHFLLDNLGAGATPRDTIEGNGN
jgi:hypothetical protein